MKRLVLHVGLPKAASTTIQVWADKNREALAALQVYYPQTHTSPSQPKHQQLIASLRNADEPIWSTWAEHHAGTVFLSAEGLTGHLDDFSESSLARFRNCHSRQVSIFMNTRDPQAWLESLWRQRLFNPTRPELGYGTDITLADFRSHPRVTSLLDPRLPQRLADAYGANEVMIGKLETDWADKLCRLLGVGEMSDALRAARQENRGLSHSAAELVRQINRQGLPDVVRSHCLAALERIEGTHNVAGKAYANKAKKHPESAAEALEAVRRVEPKDAVEQKLRDQLLFDLEEFRLRHS